MLMDSTGGPPILRGGGSASRDNFYGSSGMYTLGLMYLLFLREHSSTMLTRRGRYIPVVL
jgi:hypothetical protein